jgi:hypothetical protein
VPLLFALSFRGYTFLVSHDFSVGRRGYGKVGIHTIVGRGCRRSLVFTRRSALLVVLYISITVVIIVIALVILVVIVVPVISVVPIAIPTVPAAASGTSPVVPVAPPVITSSIPIPTSLVVSTALPSSRPPFAISSRAIHRMRGVQVMGIGFGGERGLRKDLGGVL